MDEPAERAEEASATSLRLGAPPSDGDLFSNILAPGSSLNPTFLLVVDGVLALLSLTLGSLVIVTGGNVHLIALSFIALALWASIKW
jgi:ER protein Pkr1